jgi:hypothetical protein
MERMMWSGRLIMTDGDKHKGGKFWPSHCMKRIQQDWDWGWSFIP